MKVRTKYPKDRLKELGNVINNCTSNLDIPDEMDKFLGRHKLPNLTQEKNKQSE